MARYRTPRDQQADSQILAIRRNLRRVANSRSTALTSSPRYARDPNLYDNFTSPTWTPTDNAPTMTFTVPIGGHGTITMMVRADADNAGERFRADVRIRRDNASGTVVHSPDGDDGGIDTYFDPAKPALENFFGERPLEPENLTPGKYWAQLEIDTSGTQVEIFDQWIRFQP